jgi:hypothetical protein
MRVNLRAIAAGGAQQRPSAGGALHFPFSGLSDVGADRPFGGMAFSKMRSAFAEPAARQAPGAQRALNTLGLKASLGRSTRPGSRSSPRVSARLAIIPFLRSKDVTLLMRLPSARGGVCVRYLLLRRFKLAPIGAR